MKGLKKARIKSKLTLIKLYLLTGVSSGYISDLERGTKDNPSLDIITTLAKALNTTVEYLINGEDDLNQKEVS